MRDFLRAIGRVLWPVTWRLIVYGGPVFLLFMLYVAWGFFLSSPPKIGLAPEIPPDERLRFAQIVDNGEHIVNNTRDKVKDGVYRRDAHAKTHGCVLANFDVQPTYDRRLLYGLFAAAKRYKAWVRFSSGDFGVQSD